MTNTIKSEPQSFSNRKKGGHLTNGQKLLVIEESERGVKPKDLCLKFNLPKYTVSRILSEKEERKNSALNNSVRGNSKIKKCMAWYPKLDKALYDWFISVQNPGGRCKPLPLTRQIIRIRAQLIAKELVTQQPELANFNASEGWFRNWRGRHNIGRSVRLHGEAGDVDLPAVETEMDVLRAKLEAFETEFIINMDESALLCRCLPNRISYVSE